MAQRTIDIADLRRGLRGTAVAPGEETWDEARAAWNLAADQHPAASVYAEGVHDIGAAIHFARANDLQIAPQGTGHGAGPRQPLDQSILIRT